MIAFSQLGATISERISQIRQTLPSNVRLIAVTKQVSVDAMREAYAAGVRDFGESRVQEAEAKQAQLVDLADVTWHLIGHLQSNKAQRALEIFQWIHSVDSLKLAQRLNYLAEPLPTTPQICLQVKVLPDPAKYGWSIAELLQDLPALANCQHLKIRGLMTILPLGLTESEAFAAFQKVPELTTTIQQTIQSAIPTQPGSTNSTIQLGECSMGMSGDYELAVQAGATMVRLGRILFGDRPV
jgi:pyridoxal phosphate enzyme (YggS family)